MFEFGLNDLKGAFQSLLDHHDSPRILVLPHEVGNAEDCHDLLVEHKFKTILDQLMRPHD